MDLTAVGELASLAQVIATLDDPTILWTEKGEECSSCCVDPSHIEELGMKLSHPLERQRSQAQFPDEPNYGIYRMKNAIRSSQ